MTEKHIPYFTSDKDKDGRRLLNWGSHKFIKSRCIAISPELSLGDQGFPVNFILKEVI